MEVIVKKDFGFARVLIYDNGIFHTNVITSYPLTLQQAIEISEFRLTQMKAEKALMLTTGEDRYIFPSKEALEYLKSDDRSLTVYADAYVVKSLSQRLFIKTISGLKKRSTPIAFFSSDEKAIEWLLKIKI